MTTKTLSIFYGADNLPYKDSAREIHFPLVGNTFNGANNTTKIRFYVDRIGGTDSVTWVVVSKLPNGQIGNEVLNSNNAVYDEELGEHYLELSLSSYYTTLKGDVYLSLNGYQGNIEVEQDDETDVYEIYGTPTIQATGVVKIGINYAPQVIPGSHFNTSDLQQILGALSGKVNSSNVIVVLNNISTADLTGYNNGQLFFDKTTNRAYILSSGSATTYDIYDLNTRFAQKQDNLTFDDTPTAGSDNPVKSKGIKTYVDSNFVGLTGNQTIAGQKTFSGKAIFSDANLYNGYLTTNSKNYFARVGVTTGQYVTYKLPSNYSDVGAISLTLATENYVDSAIADFLQNEYSKVNTTTYPTLDDFLASTGEEGYIYLYPIDPSDETKGYYQYIWENNAWVSLGTTQIDLSGYVQKTQTIAGITLANNISASDLTDALVFATNSDVDNLFI